MTGRERVTKSLEFDYPDRVPRDLWWVPAVEMTRKDKLEGIVEKFPLDMVRFDRAAASVDDKHQGKIRLLTPGSSPAGAFPRKGKYADEWGNIWYVAEDGIVGEVKEPVLGDLSKIKAFSPPWGYLKSIDLSGVNRICAESEKFVLSDMCANPFERMQWVRGVEKFFIDLAYGSKGIYTLRDMIHEYNLRYIKMWLKTDVDGIYVMDDWGAQYSLLISPHLWREFLKPLYKEYCDLIHEHGKYVFFHSDGYIEEVYDDVIEIGIDVINSQLFCMNIEKLTEKYKGKITFWGELDRQKLLPFGSPDEIIEAVYRVRRALEDGRGGVIAQCEWGKNNPVENIEAVFRAWSTPLKR